MIASARLAAVLVASFSLMSAARAQAVAPDEAPEATPPATVTGVFSETRIQITVTGSYTFRVGQVGVPEYGSPAALVCSCAPVVTGATASPDAAAGFLPPVAGSWTLGVRFPWDVTLTPNDVGIGVGGVGLDIGRRMTERSYLGASADWEAVLQVGNGDGNADTPGIANRFRIGGEARYNFHDGTAEFGEDFGAYEVPRRDWIGFRAGAETLDGWTTVGEFADVTLGMDGESSPGGFKMGMYISAGASFEPSSVYAGGSVPVTETSRLAPDVIEPPTSAATSTTTRSIYFTLGMTLGFG